MRFHLSRTLIIITWIAAAILVYIFLPIKTIYQETGDQKNERSEKTQTRNNNIYVNENTANRSICAPNYTNEECDYVMAMMTYPDCVKEETIPEQTRYRLKHIPNLGELPVYVEKCYNKYAKLLPHKSLLKRARKTERIFDNLVPKCSATSRTLFYHAMAKRNNFKNPHAGQVMLAPGHQRSTLKWHKKFVQKFSTLETPVLIAGHQEYINFTLYHPDADSFRPVYVNMFREPVDRFVSWYYFEKGKKRHRNVTGWEENLDVCIQRKLDHCYNASFPKIENLLYLCGHDQICWSDNPESRRRAMRSLHEEFAIIGVLDQYADFWSAMEWMFPRFFKGASRRAISADERNRGRVNRNKRRREANEESLRWMKSVTSTDTRTYNYVKHRFNTLLDYIECIHNTTTST